MGIQLGSTVLAAAGGAAIVNGEPFAGILGVIVAGVFSIASLNVTERKAKNGEATKR